MCDSNALVNGVWGGLSYSAHVDGFSGAEPDPFEDTGTENLRKPMSEYGKAQLTVQQMLRGGGKARSVIAQPELKPEVVIYSRERFNELLSEALTALGHDSIRPWTASRLSDYLTTYIMERIS